MNEQKKEIKNDEAENSRLKIPNFRMKRLKR